MRPCPGGAQADPSGPALDLGRRQVPLRQQQAKTREKSKRNPDHGIREAKGFLNPEHSLCAVCTKKRVSGATDTFKHEKVLGFFIYMTPPTTITLCLSGSLVSYNLSSYTYIVVRIRCSQMDPVLFLYTMSPEKPS